MEKLLGFVSFEIFDSRNNPLATIFKASSHTNQWISYLQDSLHDGFHPYIFQNNSPYPASKAFLSGPATTPSTTRLTRSVPDAHFTKLALSALNQVRTAMVRAPDGQDTTRGPPHFNPLQPDKENWGRDQPSFRVIGPTSSLFSSPI